MPLLWTAAEDFRWIHKRPLHSHKESASRSVRRSIEGWSVSRRFGQITKTPIPGSREIPGFSGENPGIFGRKSRDREKSPGSTSPVSMCQLMHIVAHCVVPVSSLTSPGYGLPPSATIEPVSWLINIKRLSRLKPQTFLPGLTARSPTLYRLS